MVRQDTAISETAEMGNLRWPTATDGGRCGQSWAVRWSDLPRVTSEVSYAQPYRKPLVTIREGEGKNDGRREGTEWLPA